MLSLIKQLFGSKTDLGMILKNGAVILDVRTKNEYDAGQIQNSRHIPLDTIRQQLNQLKKLNKPIITVCMSGSRSAIAKNLLQNAGIETYNGGSWITFKNKYGIK
jgi:rhodanese-related sulfurtransferase